MIPNVNVEARDPALIAPARDLATRLGLSLFAADQSPPAEPVLSLDAQGWALGVRGARENPVRVDFVGGAQGHRFRQGVGPREPLARAVGAREGVRPTVLDATAGLGRDAFLLALIGCPVRALERSPIVYTLLADGLARAAREARLASAVARIGLECACARAVLESLLPADRPEVIYLDPMFPEREKSALVKKEMRLFRAVVGEDDDADSLLSLALTRARKRVVVKRPVHAPFLAGLPPHHAQTGPSIRFDVYLTGE